MDTVNTSRFIFALVQPDAVTWLKAEVQREHPDLKLAYSRPGLVTFKHASGQIPEGFTLNSVFARHVGFSLGQAKSIEELEQLLLLLPGRLRLHVYARDEGESRPEVSKQSIEQLRTSILGAHSERFYVDEAPSVGDLVLDVVVAPPSPSDEPWFVAWHRQRAGQSRLPGGVSRLNPPEHAPSRAWSKLEELIAWSALPIRAGQTAVEIGSAPGGAVVSLLDRGLKIIGIDPGAMAPSVFDLAATSPGTFTHLALKVGAVERAQLPVQVDWLLCDANLAPTVTLRYVAYWSKQLRPHLRGILFTLKLNDERMVSSIPKLLARCGELGFGSVRAVQLPSHRRELAVLCTKHVNHRP